jgi:hypothetical protein
MIHRISCGALVLNQGSIHDTNASRVIRGGKTDYEPKAPNLLKAELSAKV